MVKIFRRYSLLMIGLLITLFAVVRIGSAEITLSSDGLNPTPFTLSSGSNDINGIVSSHPDAKYFSIVVPLNHQLTAINLVSHTNGDFVSWFAAMNGAQFTENTTSINVSNLLAQSHIGPGRQPLPYNVAGPMGLTMPLASGTYSFRMQNWGTGVTFAFQLEVEEATPNNISLQSTNAEIHSDVMILTSVLIGLVIMTIASINFSIYNTWSER